MNDDLCMIQTGTVKVPTLNSSLPPNLQNSDALVVKVPEYTVCRAPPHVQSLLRDLTSYHFPLLTVDGVQYRRVPARTSSRVRLEPLSINHGPSKPGELKILIQTRGIASPFNCIKIGNDQYPDRFTWQRPYQPSKLREVLLLKGGTGLHCSTPGMEERLRDRLYGCVDDLLEIDLLPLSSQLEGDSDFSTKKKDRNVFDFTDFSDSIDPIDPMDPLHRLHIPPSAPSCSSNTVNSPLSPPPSSDSVNSPPNSPDASESPSDSSASSDSSDSSPRPHSPQGFSEGIVSLRELLKKRTPRYPPGLVIEEKVRKQKHKNFKRPRRSSSK